jgi:hypothetical protein
MRNFTILVLIASIIDSGSQSVPAQESNPAAATVTITSTVTGMTRLDDKKVELRLEFKGDLLKAPRVLVDETKIKVNALSKTPIAVQGHLKTKEVVIGSTNSIPPGKIIAKAVYVVAAQATEITAENKAKFPAAGMARVEGKIIKGMFALGKDAKTVYAIENAQQPILLLGKDGGILKKVPESGAVVATGRLRIADNGALLLDTESIVTADKSK